MWKKVHVIINSKSNRYSFIILQQVDINKNFDNAGFECATLHVVFYIRKTLFFLEKRGKVNLHPDNKQR